jgi:hypothetical protein
MNAVSLLSANRKFDYVIYQMRFAVYCFQKYEVSYLCESLRPSISEAFLS